MPCLLENRSILSNITVKNSNRKIIFNRVQFEFLTIIYLSHLVLIMIKDDVDFKLIKLQAPVYSQCFSFTYHALLMIYIDKLGIEDNNMLNSIAVKSKTFIKCTCIYDLSPSVDVHSNLCLRFILPLIGKPLLKFLAMPLSHLHQLCTVKISLI